MPSVGYIVEDKAIGFLYKAECNMGFLEGFQANPTNTELRKEALDLVTEQLIEAAKSLKIRVLYAITCHEAIMKRCGDYNFQPIMPNCKMFERRL